MLNFKTFASSYKTFDHVLHKASLRISTSYDKVYCKNVKNGIYDGYHGEGRGEGGILDSDTIYD